METAYEKRLLRNTKAVPAQQLLGLLEKNLTGKVFASYAVITPETANLPEDVLGAIPVHGGTAIRIGLELEMERAANTCGGTLNFFKLCPHTLFYGAQQS